jgi:Tol biopolymer transport system component
MDIWVMPAAGGAPTQLTTDRGTDQWPVWSPDGSRIAFVSNRSGGNYNIWTMSASGGSEVQLTNDPAADAGPAWSPDGSRIAFHSNRTGRYEIWVMLVE